MMEERAQKSGKNKKKIKVLVATNVVAKNNNKKTLLQFDHLISNQQLLRNSCQNDNFIDYMKE